MINDLGEKDEFIKTMVLKKFSSRDALGESSNNDVCSVINQLLLKKETVNMVFAAAPSQLDFLNRFCLDKKIDFSRINAFHMDEYVGLPDKSPQLFGEFLNKHLFSKACFRSVNYINGNAKDLEKECERYSKLLKENPPDIICLGIGENGHIAFNDPDFADFKDTKLMKIVELDEICRQQQVNDKCFDKLSEVPKTALTLTIPTLIHAEYHFCIVPSSSKAEAVRNTLYSEISEKCPATILRKCKNVNFYVDEDSSRLL